MKEFLSAMGNRLLVMVFIALLLLIITSGNEHNSVITYNTNLTKSVEAIHIVTKYNNILDENKPVFANTIEEVSQLGPTSPVKFIGTMTGYGPDCAGCGRKVGCPPRQDVRNGNIYFQDADYGTVRIVASDPSIPCGSIVRISNLSFTKEPIIAIVLDRGGAIKEKTMDLLFESEKSTSFVGRQYNVSYEIIRWGW